MINKRIFLVLGLLGLYLLITPTFAWLSGWSYRQPINISNTAGDLTDYQVRIDLNSSNVGSNFNWSNNGNDIRFTNSTDDELSFWIESWNSTGQEATIWVKVISLPNNANTTIYMYYGNQTAESESKMWNNITHLSIYGGVFDYNISQMQRYTGKIISVAAGEYHTCILKSNGNVDCYGNNGYGQANDYIEGDAIGVAAGLYHTCILKSNGNVDCYGRGYGQAHEEYIEGDAIGVAAGVYHTCILKSNGNVDCYGNNDSGQANDYTGGDAIGVAAEESHTCILKSNGNVDCYGFGQANDYTGGDAIGVAAGWSHTCILKSNGNVDCYGNNNFGQANDYTGGDAKNPFRKQADPEPSVSSFGSEEEKFSITLNSPSNQTITNDNTPDFNFMVSGTETSYSCELFINDTGYGTATANNNTATIITANQSLSDGTYDWYIKCSAGGVTYQSEVREITIITPFYITNCSNLNTTGATYLLTANITNSTTKHCINISANNVTLDCQGHTIDGDDSAVAGIYSSNVTGITIKNCIVTDWDGVNVYLQYANETTIINVTSNSSGTPGAEGPRWGIALYHSDSSTIINSTANLNSIGFELLESPNSTIINSTANLNGIGFDIDSNFITIINSTANSNIDFGFEIWFSYSNTILNSIAQENNYDFNIEASNDLQCNHKIENLTGSNNLPIKYFNSSVTLQNEVLSELILCNADYSNIENITINASQSKKNNGVFLRRTDYSNLTGVTSSNNLYGLYIASSNSNTISNTIANSNSVHGFYLVSSNSNTIINSTVNSTYMPPHYLITPSGFYLDSSNSNTIINSTVNSNSDYGIIIYYSNNNTIANTIISNNTEGGLYIDSSSNNKIYNNLFNNSRNVKFKDCYEENYFNTTKQLGTRIYSDGDYIGGNYWTNSTGDGYSDTCTDLNRDGFCDNPLDLCGTCVALDYLPLSDEYFSISITLNSPPNQTITNDSTPDFNFTVFGSASLYSCELFINNNKYGFSNETLEDDTEDSYSCEGDWDACSNAVDENWDTYTWVVGWTDNNFIYENYTIPEGVYKANWIYKFKQRCNYKRKIYYWDYTTNDWQLLKDANSDDEEGSVSIPLDGLTNSILQIKTYLYTDGLSCGYYEGKAIWIGAKNNTPTIITANQSLSDGTYDWYIKCSAGGVTYQSEVREIVVDTTPPTINWLKLLVDNLGKNNLISLIVNAFDLHIDTAKFNIITNSSWSGNQTTLDIDDLLSQSGTVYVNDSITNLNTYLLNYTLTNNSYVQNTSFNANLSEQKIYKNDTLYNYANNNLTYNITHYNKYSGTLITGGTLTGELESNSNSNIYSEWSGDWLSETDSQYIANTTEAGGNAWIKRDINSIIDINFTNIHISREGWTCTKQIINISANQFIENATICNKTNVITKQQSNNTIYNDTVIVDSNVNAYYFVNGSNTDTINYSDILVQTTLPDWATNTSPYIFSINLNSGKTYNLTVNITGKPALETGYTFTKTQEGGGEKNIYAGTIKVYDSAVSEKEIWYYIPKSRLLDYEGGVSKTYFIDDKTSGFSVQDTNTSVIFKIPTTFGSSSLEPGNHEIKITYWTAGHVPIGGGGGPTTTEYLKVKPETIHLNITQPGNYTVELNITWSGPTTTAKFDYSDELIPYIVSPKKFENIELKNTTIINITFYINDTDLAQQITTLIKRVSGKISIKVTHMGAIYVRYVPVDISIYKGVPPPPTTSVCGNGVCEPGENWLNCPEDCGGERIVKGLIVLVISGVIIMIVTKV